MKLPLFACGLLVLLSFTKAQTSYGEIADSTFLSGDIHVYISPVCPTPCY